MKRAMTGGAHRGPVAHGRQRRTIRLMQAVLVAIAAGLLLFAGYSWGQATGGPRSNDEPAAPRSPGAAQVVVPAGVALVAMGAALWLGGPGGVRIPTPARLEDLATRADGAAVQRAERAGAESTSSAPDRPGPADTRAPEPLARRDGR